MTLPLAVQLYSVREELDRDFEGTIRRIAQIGYGAVEPYNAPFMQGDRAHETLRLFRELGLTVPSFHTDLPIGEAQQRVIDTALMFGAQYVVLPWADPSNFVTAPAINALADQLNQAAAALAPHHLTMAYHNHWFEPRPVEGGDYGLGQLAAKTDPSVMFELDAYWVKAGGLNPVDVITRFADRIPLLHVKDGPAGETLEAPMVAVGDGTLDYKSIIPASRAKWLIVELDRCATDMLAAIERSYQYLTREGLGHGR